MSTYNAPSAPPVQQSKGGGFVRFLAKLIGAGLIVGGSASLVRVILKVLRIGVVDPALPPIELAPLASTAVISLAMPILGIMIWRQRPWAMWTVAVMLATIAIAMSFGPAGAMPLVQPYRIGFAIVAAVLAVLALLMRRNDRA